ncbi:MAG: hypothetical protein IJG13_09430 [Kiritimatiellae bacterium]|nr:hypothetical protein [Kiritimatiellia bacterium]MBQ6327951.1 hypothetical protein [Kiritimatiellia bacterium]
MPLEAARLCFLRPYRALVVVGKIFAVDVADKTAGEEFAGCSHAVLVDFLEVTKPHSLELHAAGGTALCHHIPRPFDSTATPEETE